MAGPLGKCKIFSQLYAIWMWIFYSFWDLVKSYEYQLLRGIFLFLNQVFNIMLKLFFIVSAGAFVQAPLFLMVTFYFLCTLLFSSSQLSSSLKQGKRVDCRMMQGFDCKRYIISLFVLVFFFLHFLELSSLSKETVQINIYILGR